MCGWINDHGEVVMSDFEKFKEALESLCRDHGFMLCATGYDFIVARKMDDGDQPVYGGLEPADW